MVVVLCWSRCFMFFSTRCWFAQWNCCSPAEDAGCNMVCCGRTQTVFGEALPCGRSRTGNIVCMHFSFVCWSHVKTCNAKKKVNYVANPRTYQQHPSDSLFHQAHFDCAPCSPCWKAAAWSTRGIWQWSSPPSVETFQNGYQCAFLMTSCKRKDVATPMWVL